MRVRGRRDLFTLAHAAKTSVVTVERIADGNLLLDDTLAAATIPSSYIGAVAVAPRGAGRCRSILPKIWRICANIWRSPRPRTGSAAISNAMSMTGAPPDVRAMEVLIETIRRLSGARHVAVGANSPIPAAAAFLEQRRARVMVSLQQARQISSPMAGASCSTRRREGGRCVLLLGRREQGRWQHESRRDRRGPARPKVRFAGSYGSAFSISRCRDHPLPHRGFAPHLGRARVVRERTRHRAPPMCGAAAGPLRW